jgi:hypothetical protein
MLRLLEGEKNGEILDPMKQVPWGLKSKYLEPVMQE